MDRGRDYERQHRSAAGPFIGVKPLSSSDSFDHSQAVRPGSFAPHLSISLLVSHQTDDFAP